MKLRLGKSSRLLQRIAFLVLVFVSYSRKKLIKFDTSLILYNVCYSPSIFIYWQGSSPQNIVSISQQKMCWEVMIAITKNIITFFLQQIFLFPMLISIIFGKSFAFKRVLHNVLLKFDVKKFVL